MKLASNIETSTNLNEELESRILDINVELKLEEVERGGGVPRNDH